MAQAETTTQDAKVSRKLACGCVRGLILCEEAEGLWTAVNQQWQRAQRIDQPQAWDAYADTRQRYEAHFSREGEV